MEYPADTAGFSTLSFNIRFGLADDGENCWDQRKKALPVLFEEYRPDFIGIQEANDFQIDYLTKILVGYDFIGERRPAPPNWQNNVIFFKTTWNPTVSRHFYLSKTPEIPSRFEDSRWPRQCTIGMFTSHHRRLVCVNTHFDFAENVQTDSAVLIMQRLSKMPSEVPAVLLGDFNSTPDQSCYGIFTGENRDLPLDGPWFNNAAPKPFAGTYHGFDGHPNGDHIDWILYRGDIAPIEYKVVAGTFAGIYPSDHFPVYAGFRWIDEGE